MAINQLYSQDRKSGNPNKNDPLLSRFCSPTHQAALISSPCSTSWSSPHGSHSSYSSLVLMVLYVSTVPLVLCFSQSFPSSPPESYSPILSYPRFLSSSWLSKFPSSHRFFIFPFFILYSFVPIMFLFKFGHYVLHFPLVPFDFFVPLILIF